MKLVNECLEKVKNDYFKFLKREKIYKKSMLKHIKHLKEIYIPIAFWINKKFEIKNKTLVIGLSAGQGSGKTTVASILRIILKVFFKRNVFVISIDDFYKTLRERNQMAKKKHPLFITRGVPGTHDTHLIKNFFISLKRRKFKKTILPKFDKSLDDRLKINKWYIIKKKPEIVILEGWCVGAKAENISSLRKPINILEKNEDQNLVWRKFVNKKLEKEYKNIFSMIDYYMYMKIPNFRMVLKWRMLQETKLKKKTYYNKKIMSLTEIKRFIIFYQRITLKMIKDLSKSASVIMLLKKNHDIKKVVFK